MAKIPKSVRLKWPVGPHYLRWVDGKGAHAWARFKIKSADWYIDAMKAATREAGEIDRYVGIEMALDGAIWSLCAAVDTAGSGLLEAFQHSANMPGTGRGSPVLDDWRSVFPLARTLRVTLPSEAAFSEGLEGIDSRSPKGWLAQMRQLRDRATQHNALVRRFNVGGEPPGQFVDVPGLGPRRPMEYLRTVRKETDRLVEALLADIDALPDLLGARTDAEQPRNLEPRRLPDLWTRARVRQASGHDGDDKPPGPSLRLGLGPDA